MTLKQDTENGISYYSMGIVAEHKKLGSNDIEVIPIDVQPNQQGLVTSEVEKLESILKDPNGNPQESKLYTSKSIKADWYGDEGNRVTAPDVRRGEYVRIYRKYDTQEFYWRARANTGTRRLEKATFRFSATTDENVKELDDTNSYSIDVDCVNGTLTAKTSKANKEKTAWTAQFSGEGHFAIQDDRGNFIQVDDDGLQFKNRSDSYFTLNGDEAKVFAKNIVEESDRHIVKTKHYSATASISYTIKAPTISFDSPAIKLGSAATFNGDTFNFTGPATFSNQLVSTTQTTLTGSITIDTAVAIQLAGFLAPYL